MSTELLMPALSPTMEEGRLIKWFVKEGDTIAPGDVVAEIETDKATMEIEAADHGRIGKLLIAEGCDNVKVNTPIATIVLEDVLPVEAESRPNSPVDVAAQNERALNTQIGRNESSGGPRILASPLAHRLAHDNSIDISQIMGTGPHGRIIARDVEALVGKDSARVGSEMLSKDVRISHKQSEIASEPTSRVHALTRVTDESEQSNSKSLSDAKIKALYQDGSYDLVPHDSMRSVIAERISYAKRTIPHFYLSIDCRLDELLKARTRLNTQSQGQDKLEIHLSVNDFLIKAMALALQYIPSANATWTSDGMLYHKNSDIGVAVAVEGGLYTPIVRHSELMSLSEISTELRDLIDRARNKKLAPHEYLGGSTSISNLGMYGIKQFEAVINPPHATILAVGAAERRPVVKEDSIEIATMMTFTLSCDHRAVDGSVGADLLAVFKSLIEDPIRMLV